MVDSYYLDSPGSIKRLMQRHAEFPDCAMGPVIWGAVRTNLSEVLHYRETFYDGWSTPELRWCPYGWNPETDILVRQEKVPLKGLYQVSSLGGCYIFPRQIWEDGIRYGVPHGVHGCEHNHFHSLHVLPKYVDFQTSLYRVKFYPLWKCARVSMGNWMRR